ncbi:serine hydrolase domain-containing protein [Rufibacter latericius]|uniref:Class A beta-lactamase-related serine hydrolase n=1 Tax=Rufibacter latericius TaxID=2487040 RepID=A0A3M9MT39_9BACT|nr:serine hydrolase domain-containing protein [Rufibacter latericius]RNI28694.1 class A beta-lactamase-related serine hydrolase [Rufibacter latericius]
MNRIYLSLLLTLSAHLCFAQVDTARIREIIQKQAAQQRFSGTILLADQGRIVHQSSYGLTDQATQARIDHQTKFGIASITKMLTAIVILQLVEEGKLSLQDRVSELLPTFKFPHQDKLTVHHLLLHISGLLREEDSLYDAPLTPQAFTQKVLATGANSGKFDQFHYNNLDYVLLGLIIEAKTGTTWQAAIKTRIIDKLPMTNTGFLAKGKYPTNFVLPYSVTKNGNLARDSDLYLENYYAAGCMYSNAADLFLLDKALYGNTLLSEKSKALLYTSYPQYNYTGYSGWTYQYPFADTKPLIMERRGGILGSNSALVRMLDLNKTIIILSNTDQFNPDSYGDKENLREALLMELGKAPR